MGQPPRPPPQTGCPHAGRAESRARPFFQNTRATARIIHGLPAAARAHTLRRDTAVQARFRAPLRRGKSAPRPDKARTAPPPSFSHRRRVARQAGHHLQYKRKARRAQQGCGAPGILRRVPAAVAAAPHRPCSAPELHGCHGIRTKQLYSLFVYVVRPRGKADAGRRTAEARGHVQICAHKLRADSGKAAAEKGYLTRLPGWVDRADSLCMIVYTSPGSGGRWCPRCAAGRRTSTGAAGHVRNEYGDIDVLFRPISPSASSAARCSAFLLCPCPFRSGCC